MPLTTVESVLEETGATYGDFGFSNSTTFDIWIIKKIFLVDNKIKGMVGTHYTNLISIPDLRQGEIYWVYYEMLQRKQAMTTASVESGFALGSLRIDSSAGPAERLKPISEDFFRKARVLIEPFITLSSHKYLVVEDLDE